MAATSNTPREIEIKLKVLCAYELMAQRLGDAGAEYRWEVLETNIFFDSPDGQLRAARAALRIRHQITSDGQVLPSVVTWKGPRLGRLISNRPSIDFYAQPPEMAEMLFSTLGYVKTMEFQKRRRSFAFRNCLVELDEMPQFGFFLEIEAPDEVAVAAARHALTLDDLAAVEISYFAMVRDYLREHPELGGKLYFPRRPDS
ncbi:MAG: class IV adenylate cyclase [Phycisphaerae bacterium]